jgi:hypothetical protein
MSWLTKASTFLAWVRYERKTSAEPSRPPSSPEYQWNSRVFSGVKRALARTRRASRMVTVPEPLSSAPGARALVPPLAMES